MIAVLFEVRPADGRKDDYLAHAARLRAELETIEGFVSVERFQSLTDPGKLLSLSIFEDEAAVARWRNHARHRATQAAGRGGIFADYRLRVAEVVRDYGMDQRREQAPADSQQVHCPFAAAASKPAASKPAASTPADSTPAQPARPADDPRA